MDRKLICRFCLSVIQDNKYINLHSAETPSEIEELNKIKEILQTLFLKPVSTVVYIIVISSACLHYLISS